MDNNVVWGLICLGIIAFLFVVGIASSSSASPKASKNPSVRVEIVECSLTYRREELIDAMTLVNVSNLSDNAVMLSTFQLKVGVQVIAMARIHGKSLPLRLEPADTELIHFRKGGYSEAEKLPRRERQLVLGCFLGAADKSYCSENFNAEVFVAD